MATGATTTPSRDERDDADRPPAADLPSPREPAAPSAAGDGFWRRHLPRYTWSGTLGALAFGYFSFTPSLLPRGWLLQALIAGITAAIGYGVGVFVAWFVRALAGRGPSEVFRRRAWQVLAVLGPVVGLVVLWLGYGWQEGDPRAHGARAAAGLRRPLDRAGRRPRVRLLRGDRPAR